MFCLTLEMLDVLQEQIKRQQIQLMQAEQSQKLERVNSHQGVVGIQQSQGEAQQQQQQQQQLDPDNPNLDINNQGNIGNKNLGNILHGNVNLGNPGQGHPVVDGNVVHHGQNSLGNGLGMNQVGKMTFKLQITECSERYLQFTNLRSAIVCIGNQLS